MTRFLALGLAALASTSLAAAPPPSKPKPDLADIAAGTYSGDVISDARGASRSNVHVTVAKIGPNRVRITADYARLPAFETGLTRVMNTIQKSGAGPQVFLLDLAKAPPSLDLTLDDASWSGRKD